MELEAKTVFISYSWTNDNHVNWVVQLASRLIGDGVDVKLDKWDLKGIPPTKCILTEGGNTCNVRGGAIY